MNDKWGRGELKGLFTRVNRMRTDQVDNNVIPIPISLDALEQEIREITNELVFCEAELHKWSEKRTLVSERLKTIQNRLIERLSHLGIKGEVVDHRDETLSNR